MDGRPATDTSVRNLTVTRSILVASSLSLNGTIQSSTVPKFTSLTPTNGTIVYVNSSTPGEVIDIALPNPLNEGIWFDVVLMSTLSTGAQYTCRFTTRLTEPLMSGTIVGTNTSRSFQNEQIVSLPIIRDNTGGFGGRFSFVAKGAYDFVAYDEIPVVKFITQWTVTGVANI